MHFIHARDSARSALVGLRRDEDLKRLSIFADHTHAIARNASAKQVRETIRTAVADAHFQHRVAVVLRLKLPHPANSAQRELEAMPVVRRGKRCHNKISLARPRWRSRRWDRGLDALVERRDRRRPFHRARVLRWCRCKRSLGPRTLLTRPLFTRPRWQRSVEAGRLRGLGLLRRLRGGRCRRRLGTSADPRREVDRGLLVLLVLFVLLRHR